MKKYGLDNNVRFEGFPSVDWSKIFLRYEYFIDYGLINRIGFIDLIRILGKCFVWKDRYRICINDVQNKILCIQDCPGRISAQEQFDKIVNLLSADKIQVMQSSKIRMHSLKYALRLYLFLIPSWMKSLSHSQFTKSIRFSIVNQLICLWELNKKIETLSLQQYKLLIAYNDSMLIESYLVELFKSNHIPTVTLQHGQFVAKRANTLIHAGIEFATFKSDFMLCWNRFTIDEAIKAGISPEKLILAGILGFIGKKRTFCEKPMNKIFGVVMGHPEFEEENLLLISSANRLAKATGYQFYIKLHPNYKENHFDNHVDHTFYIGIIKKGISMIDYANMVEFSLVGSSSVFVELVYIKHDVIRLSTMDITDKFRDIKIGKIFHAPEEIVPVYMTEKNNNYDDELFEYLCSVEDINSEYKKIIKKIIDDQDVI